MKISKKTLYILCSVIIGFFIMCAILTIAIPTDDDEKETKTTEETVRDRYDKVLDKIKKETDSDGNDKSKVEEEKDPIEELSELVGLESVKEEVISLTNFIRVQKQREAQGLKTPDISYHLVFSGNPGTGKTTVARILARIYRDLGVIKKGHLVETDRSGLIGQYVGQTSPKVNALCDSALGGVLFIDEAYAITQGDNQNDYGAEAIATLLKRMEDNRDNLVVIVAGYTNEMKKFIDANPGLKSRFTRYIDFPDYSGEELAKMYMMRMNKYGFVLTSEASERLSQIMDHAVATKDRNFGNGRFARNLFENTVTAQADRLGSKKVSSLSDKDLSTITAEDIDIAYRQTKK